LGFNGLVLGCKFTTIFYKLLSLRPYLVCV
jgi:hypothetical protein